MDDAAIPNPEAIRADVRLQAEAFYTAERVHRQVASETPSAFPCLKNWQADVAFVGTASPRRYLVDGVFPMGQASLLAASGGVGKSFLGLSLALDVAAGNRGKPLSASHFGGELLVSGRAVYVSCEDDETEIHSRLDALGGKPEKLFALPLPSTGGAPIFFHSAVTTKGPTTTSSWESFSVQVKSLPELALVVLDPLQSLCGLDLNQPENAQFVCSRVSALAAETGAAIIVMHHLRKGEATTFAEAREAIRGSSGLVDGVRCVYALWLPSGDAKDGARKICRAVGGNYKPGRVVQGGVVKANGRANTAVTTFVRDDRGLLIDRSTFALGATGGQDLVAFVVSAAAEAARQGRPYTRTGVNGLYERRHELPEAVHNVGKHRLSGIADEALQKGLLVLVMVRGSRSVRWLDVPDGPFARGEGAFAEGHLESR